MDIMSSMKFALHVGTARSAKIASGGRSRWPAEFRRPVDAALHLGTPKASKDPTTPTPISNSDFFGKFR
jgi:hypothetical protein